LGIFAKKGSNTIYQKRFCNGTMFIISLYGSAAA